MSRPIKKEVVQDQTTSLSFQSLIPKGRADFKLKSAFDPNGDQPQAIESITSALTLGTKNQVLLGVTGSGKTYTMAHVIGRIGVPTLILAPNKTLAAQLYGEMKAFFPNNQVCYFVSYYDYYQPEAYVPRTDTYIDKESNINEQIDRLRHEATRALFEHRDVIIVASISCIYGIGDPQTYASMSLTLSKGMTINREDLLRQLVAMQYRRNDVDFHRGTFRVRGDGVELFPSHYEDKAWSLSFFGNEIEEINEFDPLTGVIDAKPNVIRLYANSHHVTAKPALKRAIDAIRAELVDRLAFFRSQSKLIEAQRLEERTNFDLEMLAATGSCSGIENYSRHLTGRQAGEPPPTLFEYFPNDALLIVDESHVAIPQLRGMYRGDQSRKQTLSEYGFRLPSCLDNRPLRFEEWEAMRPLSIFVSATPANWELEQSPGHITEQIVRPTGLVDPLCFMRPASNQVDDLMAECRQAVEKSQRVLVTTLTKKMAENLTDYLFESGLKVRYMHSDIDTIERIEIIRDLRLGVFDILVGINLLREGLDIPECALVAILDADKEGFLRSKTSLVQTIGRAARHVEGRVILYADRMTESLRYAIDETERRRNKQIAWNKKHNIIPRSIAKSVSDILEGTQALAKSRPNASTPSSISPDDMANRLDELASKMRVAAQDLEFEQAALLRDQIKDLEKQALGLGSSQARRRNKKSSRRR